ncbi:hypothetical protein [Allorhodopirellula heiligendammensis]|uniref:Uncharacterized protein n=1 Tax=Allorhodopirellula heiligendammensis TaxID=2714739 RepID=A0A5C6BYK1_9BACT|nr:hypothetical protein [Allorhodopirellula heiligendammensis]TWU15954.1 hypothetical protein Poly21_31580 [Allorhodopirellula heiligendammensis]
MATVTLAANANYSALTVADGDTIELAGYTLTLDVNPAEMDVTVQTPGAAGKIALGAPLVYDLPGWSLIAGTGHMLPTLAVDKTVGGQWYGGTNGSNSCGVYVCQGTIRGGVTGGPSPGSSGCYVTQGTIEGDVRPNDTVGGSYGIYASDGVVLGDVYGGSIPNAQGISQNRSVVTGKLVGGSAASSYAIGNNSGSILGPVLDGVARAIGYSPGRVLVLNGRDCEGIIPSTVKTIYSILGPINPLAYVTPGTEIIVLSGNADAALRLGNRLAQRGVNL